MKKIIRVAALGGAVALALAACGSAPEDDAHARRQRQRDRRDRRLQGLHGLGRRWLRRQVVQPGRLRGPEAGRRSRARHRRRDTSSPRADTDYTPNIDSLVAENCNLIIGVGFLLEDPIQTAAEANPDIEFALVDSAFSDADFKPGHARQRQADPVRHGAGGLPRGLRRRGAVDDRQGRDVRWHPDPVRHDLHGRLRGRRRQVQRGQRQVRRSSSAGTRPRRPASSPATSTARTTARTSASRFIDQGADIIMPVAGPVGLGTASVAKAAGNVAIVGVDADWFETHRSTAPSSSPRS